MRVNWWRGVTRIYALCSLMWLLAVALGGWVGWDEMAAPLRDERALGSLGGCAPNSGDIKGLFADPEYGALPVDRKLAVLEHLCPRTAEVYNQLSGWGKDRLIQGAGLAVPASVSGITHGGAAPQVKRAATQRLADLIDPTGRSARRHGSPIPTSANCSTSGGTYGRSLTGRRNWQPPWAALTWSSGTYQPGTA